eukprot:TRINITY_DN11225_c0_g1_i2.p1 TRINITY_DN11225_c0_g1~~TRINITY_DN11225_c0_g1_i2.p1  ORF type:complete len:121 (-),score=7.30 TRINITY_DN11225_c0_g1_i2:42-404(-)
MSLDVEIVLPKDIVVLILSYPVIKSRDIKSCSCVNKLWKQHIFETPSLFWYRNMDFTLNTMYPINKKRTKTYHEKAAFYSLFLPYEIDVVDERLRYIDYCYSDHSYAYLPRKKYYFKCGF